MQVVWEADTAEFASRKRAARACAQCQRRKKRCHHTFTRPPEQQAESDGLDKVLPNLTHKEPIRFVGDLNPESILTDLSSRAKGSHRLSRIGTWVEQSRLQQDEFGSEEATAAAVTTPNGPSKSGEKMPVNIEKYGNVDGGRRTLTGYQRSYLQAVGAFRVLPKETQDALVTTYIACIDGLLPILHGGRLIQEYTSGRVSIFLIQAICLVTCKTVEAVPYLRLYEDGPLLDPISFARSLHVGLDAAMKADLEPDRVTKIQVLTLMHLHNDGPGGIEESSSHLSQAIHDAWTAGLHIHTPGRTTSDAVSMLWWTLWILDRINACIGGRPVMISDRDIDIARPPQDSSDPRLQCLAAWLRLGDLLDKVIEFYRPTADPEATGWETEFPSFTEVLSGVDLESSQDSHKTILELSYHVTKILACRSSDPNTVSYNRRITAADRIQALVQLGRKAHIPPLPLVPYAASLSLTVAYRGLRDNRANTDQNHADLLQRSEILESLSSWWWSADAMAKLGRKALNNLRPPGTRKGSTLDIANGMAAETDACKFGPFEKKIKLDRSYMRRGRDGDDVKNTTTTAIENEDTALHLLSDAAAAVNPYISTTDHVVDPVGISPPDEGLLPVTVNMETAMGMGMDLDPFSHMTDLDNLFTGFFDLSMPTIFEDPLFNGAAYDLDLDLVDANHESGTVGGGPGITDLLLK